MTLDLSGDSFSDVDFAFFGLYGVNCRRIIISLSVNFFVEWTEFGWELLGWVTSLSLFSDGGKIFDGFFILVLMDDLDFKGFTLMDLCVLMEFCDGSQAIGLLSLE